MSVLFGSSFASVVFLLSLSSLRHCSCLLFHVGIHYLLIASFVPFPFLLCCAGDPSGDYVISIRTGDRCTDQGHRQPGFRPPRARAACNFLPIRPASPSTCYIVFVRNLVWRLCVASICYNHCSLFYHLQRRVLFDLT